ncbi:CMGC protein kinase [Aspergillus steynii IBT 23096]|uniref:non-specific serine/threonine protein kinase n=1 Tax=Aspergillus steynii IBT 23096 TaxID=1392250 RepID=A0A2I2FZ01_9EURO|nr:CMGC protein kinase [Aspergillus steynii IBT 23096]PLB45873.1 CMGC protein kinase [Aspergillus steynii IBT 23096]
MATLMRRATRVLRRTPSPPMSFPTSGFEIVRSSEVLDEERFDHFKQGQYYPANTGDVLSSKYQIFGKVGFGTTSTVWLAHDLEGHQYVTLKVYTRDEGRGSSWHPGHAHIRKALDLFTIPRAVHLLKAGLMQIFLALDYLHTECKLVHTDIKSDNILQEIEDMPILESFTQAELKKPSPRKIVNVLSDFGSAVRGDERRNHDAQPNVYRSPEVMLKTDWSYPVDIWNVGVMVWDLFEGRHLFHGNDPDGKGYSTRAHLAEAMSLLGPPPLDMLQRGKRSHEFYTDDGKWKQDIEIPTGVSLESSEQFLEGRNKEMFMAFMRGMLQWRPEDRKTAKDLLQDPWLNGQIE